METYLTQQLKAIDANIKIENIRMLSGGSINSASKVETNLGDFFVKWNSQVPKNMFLCEAEGLIALKRASTILKIPKVYLATEAEEEKPGLLVTEFLEQGTANDVF